jgi:hypothetical protein
LRLTKERWDTLCKVAGLSLTRLALAAHAISTAIWC